MKPFIRPLPVFTRNAVLLLRTETEIADFFDQLRSLVRRLQRWQVQAEILNCVQADGTRESYLVEMVVLTERGDRVARWLVKIYARRNLAPGFIEMIEFV